MSLPGLDLSEHQSTTPSLAGYRFAFCRATFGTTLDLRYLQHSATVRATGLVLGAYHFGRSGQYAPVADQAAKFLARAADADLLALDLEADDYIDPVTGQTVHRFPMSNAEASAFIGIVHAAGRQIGLYHSEFGYPASLGQDWNWVANWVQAPSIPWAFWQRSGAPLDLDVFNGDEAALAALTGDPMRTFTITGPSGTAVVNNGTQYSAIPLDGSALVKLTAGQALGTALPIHLDAPYDSRPGDRQSAYLVYVGGKDCAVLRTDATLTPPSVPVTVTIPGHAAKTLTW